MINLIAHGLIIDNGKLLLIKRSKIKRGKPNFNAERWDVPGGTVEQGESPRSAVIRETKEEIDCDVKIIKLLYDSFERDTDKNIDFLTVVYLINMVGSNNIKLDIEEHTDYLWININDIINNNHTLDIMEYIKPSLIQALNL